MTDILKYLLLAINTIIIFWLYGFILDKTVLFNPYKFYMAFGKPGAGKSTWLTAQAYKHNKKGWKVYQNVAGCTIGETYNINDLKKGRWLPDGRKNKENILLIIDEIGLAYNNRDFKKQFTPQTLEFFKEHRHRRVKIICASQSYKDFDTKLRDLVDMLSIVRRSFFRHLVLVKPIYVKIDISNPENDSGTEEQGGKIIELYSYQLIIFWRWYNIMKWRKKYNSFGDTYGENATESEIKPTDGQNT